MRGSNWTIVGTSAAAAIALGALAACGDAAPDRRSNSPEANVQAAQAARPQAYSQRIVFFDFFKTRATLFANGRPLFSGMLDVAEADESTGLSRVLDVHLKGRTTLRIVTDKMDSSRTVDITPETKIIYVSPGLNPPIEASTDEVALLD